jgi:CYTH domain-containing protein
MIEIERKYLLRQLPPEVIKLAEKVAVCEHGYLPSGGRIRERVVKRCSEDPPTYGRTVKINLPRAWNDKDSPLARPEYIENIDVATFEVFWAMTAGRRIRKRRYYVKDPGTNGRFTWEIDEFLDRDLVIAEVELDETAHYTPDMPGWLERDLVREVTHEPEFEGHNLGR